MSAAATVKVRPACERSSWAARRSRSQDKDHTLRVAGEPVIGQSGCGWFVAYDMRGLSLEVFDGDMRLHDVSGAGGQRDSVDRGVHRLDCDELMPLGWIEIRQSSARPTPTGSIQQWCWSRSWPR